MDNFCLLIYNSGIELLKTETNTNFICTIVSIKKFDIVDQNQITYNTSN